MRQKSELKDGDFKPFSIDQLRSADDVRLLYIQHVYDICGKRPTLTARTLRMNRRTLYRYKEQGVIT